MPIGFNENEALGHMKVGGVDQSQPFGRGGIAAFGRQIRKGGKEKKTDYVTHLENQAKMHAFRSELKRGEAEHLSDLRRDEAKMGHERTLETKEIDQRNTLEAMGYKHALGKDTASHEAKVKANAEIRVNRAKAKSELHVAQGKSDITNAAHAQYLAEVGGTENRSFEVNPSTGALKYGVPIKGIGSKEQFSDLPVKEAPGPVDLSQYDK